MLDIDPLNQQQAIQAFLEHVDRCGGDYSDWYVGVSANPRQTLFEYHLVEERGGQYLWCKLASFSDAQAVAEHCRRVFGTKGGLPFGYQDAIFMYGFRVTNRTRD